MSDIDTARNCGVDSFVVLPSGKIWKYDYNSGSSGFYAYVHIIELSPQQKRGLDLLYKKKWFDHLGACQKGCLEQDWFE